MKIITNKPFILTVAITMLFIFSCTEDPDDYLVEAFTNGAFISCEGSFGTGNASISYYSNLSDSIYNDIFYNANGRSVGDVLQSVAIHNENAYLVVNNSSKVEVVNTSNFKVQGVISGVLSPRYLVASDKTAYVSCWGDNSVKIVDLNTNEITGSISVSSGPDKMIIQNEKLYVANSGGWGVDSVITIVDINTNEVVKSIEVKYAPVDLVVDQQGDIWVLCFGKIIYGPEDPYPILEETASKLFKIDTETDLVVLEETLFETQHPMHLEIDNTGALYFGGGYTFGGIYTMEIAGGVQTPIKIVEDYAYGFNINPNTNELFVTLSPSYTSAGILKRYNTDGNELGSYECGISPNGSAFIADE